MKKIVAILASALMILSLCIPVFASANSFVKSPTATPAPELVEYENESDDCTAKLVVESYAGRNKLPDNIRVKFEKAYDQIVNSSSDNAYTKTLKEISKNKNIKTDNLAISELFDISCTDCANHDHHGDFTIKLKSDMFANFVALIHFTGEEWEIVDVTNLNFKEYTLTFTAGDLSPFAVVVRNDGVEPHDDTDDTGITYMRWYLLIIVIELAIIIIGLTVAIILIVKNNKMTKKGNESKQQ